MKAGWLNRHLIEICEEITDGSHFSPKSSGEDKFPYITVRDISNGVIDFDNCKFIDKKNYDLLLKNGCKPNEGDLLFSKDGTVGKVALVNFEKEFVVLSSLAILRPKKGVINSELLEYILLHPNFLKAAIGKKTGVAIRRIILKNLKQIEINFPKSLTEQKQIVALLDQAFAAIDQAKANIEKNIENAKELFQSKLNEIFSHPSTGSGGDGWEEKSLGELGKPSMCKRILKEQTKTEGDIPFYKIGTFGKTPNAFISKEIYEEFKTKYSFPKVGDVLISASGTIGRRVIYDGEPAFFQDSNIVWIDNNEEFVLNEYLYQFYGVCDWNPSKGATISRLYNADLKRIRISFPHIEAQKSLIEKMVNLSDHTEEILLGYEQKANNLEELKKSILQKAFAGELTGKEVLV